MADEAASILSRAGPRGAASGDILQSADASHIGWFERELPSLVPAVARAYELERFDLCLRLADAATRSCHERGHRLILRLAENGTLNWKMPAIGCIQQGLAKRLPTVLA